MQPSFDPKQLDAFAATLQTGSLNAAAKQLRITLAAVSLRIKALETQLGQRLLVRGKQAQATRAGQALLAHIGKVRLLEADLAERLSSGGEQPWQALPVAVNADSLASWFLPGVSPALQAHKLLLHSVVDDQEYTLQWMQQGDVLGCVTELAQPLRGCIAQPLGIMRYRCRAAPSIAAALQTLSRRRKKSAAPALLALPALCFNAKDHLQDRFIQAAFGLKEASYPRHHLPAVDAYHLALQQGLGWGMQADVQLGSHEVGTDAEGLAAGGLVDLFPGQFMDVALYWHHWSQESAQANRLTQAVLLAANKHLLPLK